MEPVEDSFTLRFRNTRPVIFNGQLEALPTRFGREPDETSRAGVLDCVSGEIPDHLRDPIFVRVEGSCHRSR